MFNDEPDIEESKTRRRDDEEVHRSDAILVVAQKRHPSLLLTAIGCSLREITRDSCEAYTEAELLELSLNLPTAPAVLVCQPPNECLHLLMYRSSETGGRPGPRFEIDRQ